MKLNTEEFDVFDIELQEVAKTTPSAMALLRLKRELPEIKSKVAANLLEEEFNRLREKEKL